MKTKVDKTLGTRIRHPTKGSKKRYNAKHRDAGRPTHQARRGTMGVKTLGNADTPSKNG